ncbi:MULTISPECIES: tRNA glutamyl-Q(34) synthetase GluQRS [Modicisalibacter]|uniref:Glutamyl-Q tRNA(Asp) synthetase n=1 Tax=Modicisalibacter tunisiensis TaxID=390637 RepID=A0ABS7WV91_9GAMM|nr:MULTISPECIES: tRNA glutamyl-Q(34) synthetase GluQRS [Modicisalibacter]MBZ9540074.1 tRNA glutamyl-Q(34) synthetase GluQRS [Modicisalibacter tunisiensis]MBZ9566532.1 tRNA glutamyl-Q(34) synthetase GluQRS [Modicisalibacter tunisiensis]
MPGYRGRFAPTPSGPLHLGSLVAALGSYLDARHVGGTWLLRIEDVDPPRCPPGTADAIRRQLEIYGLHWDGEVRHQRTRDAAYQAALDRLAAAGLAYPCSCSRKEWREHPVYPGWCRDGVRAPGRPLAWRLRSDLGERPVIWHDRLFGAQCFDPAERGDVVLKRKEGLWAYQLAVVVDDADQGITDVVRGVDLLDNTPWQWQLQAALGVPHPRYLHLPLVVAENGQKLSKQNLAPALPEDDASVRHRLHDALGLLAQAPPAALRTAPVAEQLAHAVSHWDPGRLDARAHLPAPPA